MKIGILVNDGSSIGVTCKTIWGDERRIGCGGSELAILTLCEMWTHSGHEVILYNSPWEEDASPFEQRHKDSFDTNEYHDILIVFRSPNYKVLDANAGKVIWLSFDQFTLPSLPFRNFAPFVDNIICISEYHANYFKTVYGIENTRVIDLPVRIDDFYPFGSEFSSDEKVKNRIVFTSVPTRGLMNLRAIWPYLTEEIPDISLLITSDFRLWGTSSPLNSRFFLPWLEFDNVMFLGAVSRERYVDEVKAAEVLLYPHKEQNAELFCLSVAEAQVAGVYCVTSGLGALSTTNMCKVIHGDPETKKWRTAAIDYVVELLSNRDELRYKSITCAANAIARFSPHTISAQWEEVFNEK